MSDLNGLTLVGVSLGPLTGIKQVVIGDVEIASERIHRAEDTKKCGTLFTLSYTDGPMTITFHYNKTVHNTLKAAAKAMLKDTFTLTDAESSANVGAAYVTKCGGMTYSKDAKPEFQVTLEPETDWDFAPGS